jgi:hypothetical protein
MQGVVDPSAGEAGALITPVKGHEKDKAFLRAQRLARRSPKGASRVAKAFRGGWAAMFKKARKEAFDRVTDDFKLAFDALENATTHLTKIGAAFGGEFSEHVGTLSSLTKRLKKAVSTGHVVHERSWKKPNKNRGRDD